MGNRVEKYRKKERKKERKKKQKTNRKDSDWITKNVQKEIDVKKV